MKKLLFIILILGLSPGIRAQKLLDFFKKYKDHQDTSYIAVYPQTYSLKTYVSFRNFTLKLTDLDGFGNPIAYKPNTPVRLGFVGSYKDFRFGFGVNLPSFYPERGTTKSFGMFINTQTNIFSWGFDFYFLRNKGYYLDDPQVHLPLWDKSMDYPFREDIRTLNIGLATHLVFSKKFSLKAAIVQSERQLKSAGGIALDLAIKYSGLKNDAPFIPYTQQPYYSDIVNFRKGGFLTFAISPGYAYTYVLNNFYSTSLGYLGLGLQTQSYLEKDKRSWKLQVRPKIKFMQIIGYTVHSYFGNVSFTYENNLVRVRNTRFNSSFISVNIGGGFRF
jgi:hypothetical protein